MLGFSLDNVDNPAGSSYTKLVSARAEVIGTLWTNGTRHRRNVYDALESLLDKPRYTLRVGPSQQVPVSVWCQDFTDAMAEVSPNIITEGRIDVRHFNEGNLPDEGNWHPETYAQHYITCRNFVKSKYPNLRFGPMPLSLGLTGWQEWWDTFWSAISPGAIDFVSVNCYAHLIHEVDFFLQLGRPVKVTEYNTLNLAHRPEWLLATYAAFRSKGVESAEIFIVGGQSHGAWDENYIVSLAECEELGRRATTGNSMDFYPKAQVQLLTTNFTPGGAAPKIIVLHGTSGLGNPYNYWNNPATRASADLWIPREGPRVVQYVKFGDTSWSNGPLNKPDMTVPFLAWLAKYQTTHPNVTGNTWTLSVEFEKAPGNKQGLTKWQIAEGRELLEWASNQFAIPLDRTHVLGHYQFDSVNRPFCPGPMPWDDLLTDYAVLAEPNFWAPMFNAANWARGKGRITTAQQLYIHGIVNADKEAAGVQ